VAVYGSVNGVNTQMMALSSFTILSGVFLCTMGYRLEKPSLGIMGYLTFGMAMWAALANCKPPNGYPNDLIVMIAVPMCAGIVGAIVYFMFSVFSIYFSGGKLYFSVYFQKKKRGYIYQHFNLIALGGLALAFFICSWKYDLLIENVSTNYLYFFK
jgi:hypothetical protein